MKRINLILLLLISTFSFAQSWQSKTVVRIQNTDKSFYFTLEDSSTLCIQKQNVSYIVTFPNSNYIQIGYLYDGATSKIMPCTNNTLTQPLLGTNSELADTLNAWLNEPSSGSGGSGVQSVVAGTNITVDATDPLNPIVSASGGGSGDNIYTVDGTILDDRTVDMDDKSLIFQSASNYLAFNQDPFEEGNQVAYLKYGDSVDLNDQQQSYLVLGDNGATNPNVRIGVGGVDGDSITAMIDISKNIGAGTTSLNIEAGDISIRPSVNLVISNRPLDNDATILYAKNASGNTVELEKSSISGYRGTATLSSGTVTVSTASIHTGYKIYVSVDTPSGTLGFLSAPTGSIVDGTEFVINSSSVLDNSTVNWWIAP